MDERAVILNETTQGMRPLHEGLAWFEGLDESEQTLALRDLGQFCHQARPTGEETREAIRRSGLRPSHTPCVMIMRGRV